jgi:hypothetical protein
MINPRITPFVPRQVDIDVVDTDKSVTNASASLEPDPGITLTVLMNMIICVIPINPSSHMLMKLMKMLK